MTEVTESQLAAQTTNNRIHDGLRLLRENKYELCALADALYVAGNDRVSEALFRIVGDIEAAHEEIKSAWGQEIADKVRSSEQSTANMIEGMLNSLAKRSEDDS